MFFIDIAIVSYNVMYPLQVVQRPHSVKEEDGRVLVVRYIIFIFTNAIDLFVVWLFVCVAFGSAC